jgi:hypothetical protein
VASFETRLRDGGYAASSAAPQDERLHHSPPAHPEEGLSLSKARLEGMPSRSASPVENKMRIKLSMQESACRKMVFRAETRRRGGVGAHKGTEAQRIAREGAKERRRDEASRTIVASNLIRGPASSPLSRG